MNDKFDSSTEHNYSQSDLSRTIFKAMFLPQDSVMSANTTARDKNSERSVIFGLGLISILLLASGIQLHCSVSLIPTEKNTIKTEGKYSKILSVSSETFTPQNPQQLGFYNSAIENALKNSISHGKF